MDVLGQLFTQYGPAGAGWLLFGAGLVLLLTGRLKTKSSVDDARTIADQRVVDAVQQSEAWRDSYFKMLEANQAHADTAQQSVETGRALTALMAKLEEALRDFDPAQRVGGDSNVVTLASHVRKEADRPGASTS